MAEAAQIPEPADSTGRTAPSVGCLSELERQVLAFEKLHWKYPGARDSAIRETFDMSPVRYAQVLNALLDTPAALAHDPVTVNRLRRLRETRRRHRTRDPERRTTTGPADDTSTDAAVGPAS